MVCFVREITILVGKPYAMRKVCQLILPFVFSLCTSVMAQGVDSVRLDTLPSVAVAKNIDLLPQEFSDLVRRRSFARRQREREEAFEYSLKRRVPQHDVRVNFGFFPFFDDWSEGGSDRAYWNPAYELIDRKYNHSIFERHCIAASSASYAFCLGRWGFGATLSYTHFGDRLTPVMSSSPATTLREHYFSVMPMVRFSWVYRKKTRFYSGLEVGPQMAMRRDFFEDKYESEMRTGFHFTMVGFSTGRKCFFSAELGYGCRGVINFGFGWRFDANKGER